MTDAMTDENQPDFPPDAPKRSFWSRHPRFAILTIAAVFYLILLGMCAVVVMILYQQG
jgi:hypothetical protein